MDLLLFGIVVEISIKIKIIAIDIKRNP